MCECSVTFSLWRATQIGIRCLEMWIFCLFIFNTFVFVKLYRLLPDLQKTPFCTVSFSARHKEACPARGQSSSLRSSTNPYTLPRVRFFFVSLWRATQIGIRCLEMWIFCLFLFNTFVFVKLYRLLPDLQKTPFCTVFFSARHKELESLTFGSVDQRSIQLS